MYQTEISLANQHFAIIYQNIAPSLGHQKKAILKNCFLRFLTREKRRRIPSLFIKKKGLPVLLFHPSGMLLRRSLPADPFL